MSLIDDLNYLQEERNRNFAGDVASSSVAPNVSRGGPTYTMQDNTAVRPPIMGGRGPNMSGITPVPDSKYSIDRPILPGARASDYVQHDKATGRGQRLHKEGRHWARGKWRRYRDYVWDQEDTADANPEAMTYDYSNLDPTITSQIGLQFAGVDPLTYMNLDTDARRVEWDVKNLGSTLTKDRATDQKYTDYQFGEWQDTGEFDEDGNPIREFVEGAAPLTEEMVNIFDPQSVLSMILAKKNLNRGDIMLGEIEQLTPADVAATEFSYYEPIENLKRESLVRNLSRASEQAGTGGFASSGMRDVGLSEADAMYRAGYGDLISEIEKRRADALDNVMKTMLSWENLEA